MFRCEGFDPQGIRRVQFVAARTSLAAPEKKPPLRARAGLRV